MKRELQLYIQDTRVDLFKDETVSLTDTIKNVKDISKIFTTFTKTFTLPASHVNNKLFKHYYNFDIIDGYDARVKKDARIEIDHTPYKEGKIKLEGVDMKSNQPHTYRVTFFGKTVDLKDIIGEDKLNNLDFVEVKASGTQTGSAQTNKLNDSSANFTSTVSLGDRVKNVTTGTYATVTAINSNTQLTLNADRFQSTSQNYEVQLSTLWESDSIKQKLQINPTTSKNSIITPLIGATNKRMYYDSGTNIAGDGNLYWHGGGGTHDHGVSYTDLKFAVRLHTILEAIENTYTTANGYPTNIEFTNDFFSSSNTSYFNLFMWLHRKTGEVDTSTGDLSYQFTVDSWSGGDLNQGGAGLGTTYAITTDFADFGTSFNMSIADSTTAYTIEFFRNGTSIYSTSRTASQGAYTLGTTELGAISTMGGTWNVVISSNASVIISNITITLQGVLYDGSPTSYTNTIQSGNITTPEISSFDIAAQIPEIKVIDFLMGLFKMFNLVAYVNESGKIEVRTLDNAETSSYYHSSRSNSYDITKYVDIDSSSVNVALPYKEVVFEYEDLKSYLALTHEQLFNQKWGALSYNQNTSDNFLEGASYLIKIPFAHFKYERLIDQDTGSNTAIQIGWSVNENQEPYKDKPLIFYPISVTSGSNPIQFLVNGSGESITTFNVPSNSQFLNNSTGENNIHFKAELNEYDRPLATFSDTLFERYYKNYITAIFQRKNRLTKIKAKLPLSILLNYELNDILVINGINYRINSITTNLTTGEADIELLNVL